jgi:hypothetical protein
MDTTSQYRLSLCLVLLVTLSIGTIFFAGPAAGWVYGYVSGILYVVFWTVVVALIVPSLSPWMGASGVFIVTCGLEFLQLWSPSSLHTLRQSFVGHFLLGSTFDQWDFFHYVIGAAAGALLVQALVRREPTEGEL